MAAQRRSLEPYPLAIRAGAEHVAALAHCTRLALEPIDTRLWLVEAHLQAEA